MNCPYCAKEMETGYLRGGSGYAGSEYGGGDFPGIKSDVKGSDYPADFAPPVFV